MTNNYSPSKKPIFVVTEQETGQRVDNILFKKYKNIQKTQWYKLLRKGQVRVNGKRIKPLQKVAQGDQIRIPASIYFSEDKTPAFILQKERNKLYHQIIYENDRFLIIDKPAGMSCHSGSGVAYGVIEILQSDVKRWPYIQLCHRLDRYTSGCLVCAKDRLSLVAFQQQLKDFSVKKEYVALLSGLMTAHIKVDQPLDVNHRVNGKRVVTVSNTGKPAITLFSPIQARQKYSLVSCQIEYGRTHQIRVHAAFLGHPVLGDTIYGDGSEFCVTKKRQLFLHAHHITFFDGKRKVSVKVEIPEIFNHYVNL